MGYSIFDVIKDTIQGTTQIADQTTIDNRIAVCNVCDEQNRILRVCTKCGCWIPGKAKYSQSFCPIGRW